MPANYIESTSPEVARLLEALGIDRETTTRVEIVITAGDVVMIHVARLATGRDIATLADAVESMKLKVCRDGA
jgi:alkyl hydroperoxide reductase subunit AhpC